MAPARRAAGDPVTTRYVYDANARLRFLVSAEGRVTENRYGSPTAGYGLLTQTLLYVGQLYDVTGLGPAQQLTEAELDELGRGTAGQDAGASSPNTATTCAAT